MVEGERGVLETYGLSLGPGERQRLLPLFAVHKVRAFVDVGAFAGNAFPPGVAMCDVQNCLYREGYPCGYVRERKRLLDWSMLAADIVLVRFESNGAQGKRDTVPDFVACPEMRWAVSVAVKGFRSRYLSRVPRCCHCGQAWVDKAVYELD